MRVLIFCLVVGSFCFGQTPVSTEGDSEPNTLTVATSGEKKQVHLINDFKADPEKAFQVSATDAAQRYYQAFLDDDLMSTYQMMCKSFRDGMSIQSYLKKDRVHMQEVHIKDIHFQSEGCARVSGSTTGNAGGQMGTLVIPIRLNMFLEDGKWVVFSDPKQLMGFSPQIKKVALPCGL